MPESPAGVLVRCAACGGVTPSPNAPASPAAIPGTLAAMPSAPTAVFGPSIKGAASPPPANPGRSTAGGIDEVVGGGALLLGILSVKTLILFVLSLVTSCAFGMIWLVLSRW